MIPVNRPLFNGNEKQYLNDCIDSGWVGSEGEFVSKFETKMAEYVGRKYATSCSNGSAALDLAIRALELPAKSEIILPTMTIISCAQSIVTNGHIPVVVDCDLETFNIKTEDIEKKITSRTRAIMIVHIYGLCSNIDEILILADKYNLKIIEDAAEVHGLNYKSKKCGSFGDISTFSFYPNKHITTGEGGMVLTDDPHLINKVQYYKNLCFSNDPNKRFIHDEIGWNYRFTNLQGALGLAQLEQLDQFISRKKHIGNLYNTHLSSNFLQLPLEKLSYCENIYWVYPVVLKKHNSDWLRTKLYERGIATRPFFYPIHKQPVFLKSGLFNNESLPNSEKLYEQGLYLPSGLGNTDEEILKTCEVISHILK